MNIRTYISLAAVAYILYDTIKQSDVLKELQDKIDKTSDRYAAQFNELATDMENAIKDDKGYVDRDVTADVRIEVSSIDDKYWCMAGWVTFENKSTTKKIVSGVKVQWSYEGQICAWQLWEKDNTYTIPAKSSTTIRLHSVNTKVVFPAKNSREIIKKAFRYAKGTKQSLVGSVGNTLPITADVVVMQTVYGYTTPHLTILLPENVKGTVKYASYGEVFAYASKINGAELTDFEK